MINYFLKVTICWGLFYLIYTLFLSKETFFNINRWYLLGTLMLGLIIPIIPIDLLYYFSSQPTTAGPYIHPIVEPIVTQVQKVDTVIAVQTAKEEIRYGLLFLWLIYAIGVCVKLSKFGSGLRKIYKLYQTGAVHQKGNYKLVLTKEIHLPFSFFNYLFWSQGTHIEEKDAGTIITHEVAHINQWHSIDTLLLEWLSVWLWFSPPIYWYKKSLKDIHEYLADACVLKDTKTKQYGQLLLKQAQSSMQLALASHFLDSQLKKRILMMTKNQSSNQALMKYLSALPLLVLMIMVFSNPQVRANLNATAQLSIDYLNPNVEVPPIPASLLLWIGGDFDRAKAKKVLEAAYACEGNIISKFIILSSGEKVEVERESDRIKELHKAVIFLVRKFPLHINEVHDLAIEVADAEGYALRFHEDGESIIYRELNPTKKKKGIELVFDGNQSEIPWANKLLLLNNEIVGPVSGSLNTLGEFRIPLADIVEISPEEAIEQYGEELGKNGAVNFFTDQFNVVNEGNKKILRSTKLDYFLKGNFLVVLNDSIVGVAPQAYPLFKISLSIIDGITYPEVVHLPPSSAIMKYGEELGKYGAMEHYSPELTTLEEYGKKLVVKVADLENIKELFVNGTAVGLRLINEFVPKEAIKSTIKMSKEDRFMRGLTKFNGNYEAIKITLNEEYSLIRDGWMDYKVISKKDPVDKLLFSIVDQMPVLKDCSSEGDYKEQKNCTYQRLTKFISENINYQNLVFSERNTKNGIIGSGNVRFTIELDGTMTNSPLNKSNSVTLVEEVVRVIELFKKENPTWIPGQQNGQAVRVVQNMPIRLTEDGDGNRFLKVMNTGPIKISKDAASTKDISVPIIKDQLYLSAIYPNPATDHIMVGISNENEFNGEPIQLKIVSLDGKELYQGEIDGAIGEQLERIDFKQDVKGMVIVTITRGEYSVERKVMVQ